MTMQREDVERVWPERMQIRDTGLHDDLGGPGQRIYTTAGRGYERVEYVRGDLYVALLAERDAAFAAGQEDMRERAAKVVYKAWQNCHLHDEVQEMLVDDIRELPIKDKPDA